MSAPYRRDHVADSIMFADLSGLVISKLRRDTSSWTGEAGWECHLPHRRREAVTSRSLAGSSRSIKGIIITRPIF